MTSEHYCRTDCPHDGRDFCPRPPLSQRLGETARFAISYLMEASSLAQGQTEAARYAAEDRKQLKAEQQERGTEIIGCIRSHEAGTFIPPTETA